MADCKGKYYIGIDLGGTNIAVGIVDENCKLLLKKSMPTGAERPAEDIITDMATLSIAVTKEAGLSADDIISVGIGSPGTIDSKNGIIIYANNLPFRNTRYADIFRKTFDKPVFAGNDADCAALGEAYAGAAKGCNFAIMITLGTGVGGGIIINKKIYSGFNGAGGELGHMVVEYDGWPCTCGRNGCWEAYSSATGLIRMTAEAMNGDKDSYLWKLHETTKDVSGKSAFIAARNGDKAAIGVVEKYIKYLGCGISNIINIFQPEVLCVGGGVSKEGEALMTPLREYVKTQVYSRTEKQTELKAAELGNDAGIIGSAMLGI